MSDFLNNKIELGDTVVYPHKTKEGSFDIGIVEKADFDWVWLINGKRKRTENCIVVKSIIQSTR